MNLKTTVSIALLLSLAVPGCDRGSVGEFEGTEGGGEGSMGVNTSDGISEGSSTSEMDESTSRDGNGGGSSGSGETDTDIGTTGASSVEQCGCLTSFTGYLDSACEEVPLACPAIEVNCDQASNYDPLNCLAVVDLDLEQLDALDCQLDFLQRSSTGTVSIRVSMDSGYAGAWRTHHVDNRGFRTGLQFYGVDSEGVSEGRTGGEPSAQALACEAFLDPNERLSCAWEAFFVGDSTVCD